MSRIEQLIAELCPDGVEWKELGEVMSITRGASPRPINNFITNDKDGVPWIKIGDVNLKSKFITQTKEKITKEGAEKSRLLKKGDFVLSNSMSFGRPYILAIDGCIHDGWISMQNFENVLIADFLYYILSSDIAQNYWKQKASSGTVQNLNADIVRATKIPIPPLPIQQEIVTILDTFTALDASLQAELEARRKQYEHYRNQLLNFEGKEVEWKMFEDCFEMRNGYTPSKSKPEYWENGTIPWFRMEDIRANGKILSKSIQQITKQAIKGGKLFPANSIIIATSATIGEHALITTEYLSNQRFTCFYPKKKFTEKINMMYMYYYSFILSEWCKNNTNVSGFASVDMTRFRKLLIPIPPLSEQERIVGILDQFDSLVNVELPAEIDARRKQYEYYREKLLTFESKFPRDHP